MPDHDRRADSSHDSDVAPEAPEASGQRPRTAALGGGGGSARERAEQQVENSRMEIGAATRHVAALRGGARGGRNVQKAESALTRAAWNLGAAVNWTKEIGDSAAIEALRAQIDETAQQLDAVAAAFAEVSGSRRPKILVIDAGGPMQGFPELDPTRGEAGDDSTTVEPTTAEDERDFGSSAGRVALEVDPGHYRFWNFAVGSAEPVAEFAPVLDEVAQVLSEDANARVRIVGHTSASGADAYNEALSEERAYRVMEELRALGVDDDRMIASGMGESDPLMDENGDPAAMARNRRVELHVDLIGGVGKRKAPAAPKQEKWRVPCKEAEWEVRYYKALREAWAHSRGHRDEGGDGTSFKPDRTWWVVAFRVNKFSDDEAKLLFETYVPERSPNPKNPEWDRSVAVNQALIDNDQCDKSAPFEPGYRLEAKQKRANAEKEKALDEQRETLRDRQPLPSTPAPGGQRY